MERAKKPRGERDYSDSRAAIMLRAGLDAASKERRLSIRALGKILRYKQATVLSHMANGRVGIPVDRATEIARAVGLNEREFLLAVVAQRAPEAEKVLADEQGETFSLASEVELIAGVPLDQLSAEHKEVIRNVVADPQPARRWLSLAELQTVAVIRNVRPTFRSQGLPSADLAGIEALLEQ